MDPEGKGVHLSTPAISVAVLSRNCQRYSGHSLQFLLVYNVRVGMRLQRWGPLISVGGLVLVNPTQMEPPGGSGKQWNQWFRMIGAGWS